MSAEVGLVRSREDRSRWLEVVTDTGLAQLTVDELLDELLEKVIGLMAVDTAAVLMLDPSRQVLVATVARGIEEEVHQGVRIPLGRGFAGRIAEERHWVAIEQVNHNNVLNPILREKGITSLLGVPLVAAGKVLGVLHVGTLTRRRFTKQDAELLQMVADRAAMATQSRISQNERAAAAVMVRHMLPARLPELAGLEFASRYVAGGDGEVGGDWYDVFTLPSGTVCLVVGDVVGHGLAAAQSMSQIRAVLRSTALRTEDPADVLTRLDEHVRHFQPHTIATVVCALLDPSTGALRMSSAGHPPPSSPAPTVRPRRWSFLPTFRWVSKPDTPAQHRRDVQLRLRALPVLRRAHRAAGCRHRRQHREAPRHGHGPGTRVRLYRGHAATGRIHPTSGRRRRTRRAAAPTGLAHRDSGPQLSRTRNPAHYLTRTGAGGGSPTRSHRCGAERLAGACCG